VGCGEHRLARIAERGQLLLRHALAAGTRPVTPPQWDGLTYFVSFGEGPNRNWDDAREYGFVAAGGGSWYSKKLRQLQPGNRVFAYIPKGNGVGGYGGLGEVTGPAVMVLSSGGGRVLSAAVAGALMSNEAR
jgi:hypothetical protein